MRLELPGTTMGTLKFRFDEVEHKYWLGDRRLPGATEVLKGLGIIDVRWAAERDLIRGQAVHLGCKYLAEKCLDWASVDPSIKGYIDAYGRFLGEGRYLPNENEVPVHHPIYMFGTIPDSYGAWEGKHAILEFKTYPMPVWATLQTAAHALAVGYKYDIPWQKFVRLGLQLNQDGTHRVTQFSDPNDGPVFLSAVVIYNWKMNNEIKGEYV